MCLASPPRTLATTVSWPGQSVSTRRLCSVEKLTYRVASVVLATDTGIGS